MKIYPDPEKWRARLAAIPQPLRKKATEGLDAEYEKRGFRTVASGTDEYGSFVEVKVRPGTRLKETCDFLTSTDTAAVTLQPEDATTLLGKNPVSIGLRRNLEFHGADSAGLDLLEPNQLADALHNAQLKTLSSGEAPSADLDWLVTKDMVDSGLLSQAEVDSTDAWLEAEQPRMGLEYVGDPAGRYTFDSDMGEFAPDPDAEAFEWGANR